MQISLEQILSVLMGKVEALEAALDDLRLRNNIILRLVKNSGELDREMIQKAVKEELEVSKKAGLIEDNKETLSTIDSLTDSIYKWLTGDVEDIKAKMDEYRKKMEEVMKEQESKVIDVAPPDFVKKLEPKEPKKNGGIIL
ncbi:MAG: hypothetical protein DRP32_01490 [Thermotogae bacterium]|uniref:hypothetical protein n=1 Tax=Kosmotoga sp. TaxID=1955248 RepID=UPI000F0F8AE6|nr:hypothetical protein [Kosmotoga sp.]MBO8165723.1 hypothetical protein [Kosmotoga sp.]MCD6160583.1 hypothetical protein [Kosmotoga sp.]RKX50816.1 MAG: hypothetical protein DRP32_01490 [Thermotogota bacterium]